MATVTIDVPDDAFAVRRPGRHRGRAVAVMHPEAGAAVHQYPPAVVIDGAVRRLAGLEQSERDRTMGNPQGEIVRAVDRVAGGVVVPCLCRFGNADHRHRRCRHRGNQHPAAGDGGGSAQPDLARHCAPSLGTAPPRILDVDHARPDIDRD